MRKRLGKRIQQIRELRGLSQSELARALKVSLHTIGRWERGQSWPEYERLGKACAVMGARIEDMFLGLAEGDPGDFGFQSGLALISRVAQFAAASPKNRDRLEGFLKGMEKLAEIENDDDDQDDGQATGQGD